jgi:putative ABC transport system substrate-binding protein
MVAVLVGAALLALAALGGPGSLAQGTPSGPGEPAILVLVSQDAPPYEEALSGFRQALKQQGIKVPVEVQLLHGDEGAARAALEGVGPGRARLLLTLGSLATRTAVRQVRDVPIVSGLILGPGDLERAPNATGVVLEFDVETEFRWLQRLLPSQKNVGVLYSSDGNQARVDSATRVARALGMILHARKVESPRDLPDALDSLTERADVLWGVADDVVLTPQTVQPILLFSIRNRIPFVGLSANWVKAGALYALDRDYDDIGRQCAEMAVRILNGASPGSLRPAPPRKVVYVVNRRTAKLMKLDFREGLLGGAHAVIE